MSPKQLRKTKRSYTKDDLNPEKHEYKLQRDMPTREQLAATMRRFKENPETVEQAVQRIVDALIDDVKYCAEMKAKGIEVPYA